jgi:glycosyltransferase involved in cell wall biosynthesis
VTQTRLLFVLNDASFFVSHRLPIATAAIEAGFDVHLAAPASSTNAIIRSAGIDTHELPMQRGHSSATTELRAFSHLASLYQRLRPTVVHNVTVKPVLYGSLVARAVGIPAVVNAISGLGFPFLDSGIRAQLRRRAILNGYRIGFGHPHLRVIFQNPDDRALFVARRVIRPDQSVLMRGSGVDLSKFQYVPEPEGVPVVMLAARILWHKGVGEFVRAAEILRTHGLAVRFVLVGEIDRDNPAGVPIQQVDAWCDSGTVEWWGPRDDMPATLAKATIVCLPSYREGLPKVLQEAAACGRAIITTDAPGCREAVIPGDNGILIPVGDAGALALAIGQLLSNDAERRRMARRSRAIAEAEFDVQRISAGTIAVYHELIAEFGHSRRRPDSAKTARA